MRFPIVNTPFARDSATANHLHFFSNCGILLHPADGRELPPYPGRYPGPWLGPLSFVARHPPVRSPCTVERVGTSALVETRQSDEQHVPVPMAPQSFKTDSAQKTGGFVVHHGRPYEKVPSPASFRPLVSTMLRG